MADNASENDDSKNVTDDDADLNQDNSVADTDDIEAIKEENARIKAQNTKLFERTKKAEGFEKQPDGTWVKVVKKPEPKPVVSQPKPVEVETGLTPKDTLVLMDNKITNEEDIDSVLEFAQFKKISVSEALKSSVVKTMLAEKAELRRTANATNTAPARRGTTKPEPEAILAQAAKGQYPEDADELAEARIAAKSKK